MDWRSWYDWRDVLVLIAGCLAWFALATFGVALVLAALNSAP